jgi:hypothetical protein
VVAAAQRFFQRRNFDNPTARRRRGLMFMIIRETTDATLFSLVHGVLEAERQREAKERREGRRHSYRCLQLIAPLRDGELPDQSMFQPMQCVDLSAGGLAYLTPELPDSQQLIVALGTVPFLFLTAQIVRHERVVREGQATYRVACRFTGRIVDRGAGDRN